MSKYESYNFTNIMFFKVSEDNKVLKGHKYEIVSYDDYRSTGVYLQEGEYGQYYIKSDMIESDTFAVDILPKYFKEFIEKINTFDEYQAYANSHNINLYIQQSYAHNGLTEAIGIGFYVPVKIKEITGTPGYKSKDLSILFYVKFNVSYDNNGEVQYKFLEIDSFLYNYVDLNDYVNVKSMDELASIEVDNYGPDENVSCFNTENDMIIMEESMCTVTDRYGSLEYSLVPYFVQEKGQVKLEITNTVNGLTKYNASKNKTLEYKIIVKNSGDIYSSENIITTNVPDKITVDEKSISNLGVYNKQKRTITWNIDKIDANEEITLSYKAEAPLDANGEELIGNSTVSSKEQEAVYSNNTIVTLDKIIETIENPNTGINMVYIPHTNIGMPVNALFVILITICITSIILLKKVNKKKFLHLK